MEVVKKHLITYIKTNINLTNYKYKILEKKEDLDNFDSDLNDKKLDYYVSINYTGDNCLLIITKIDNEYQAFLIDRKTLNYQIVNTKLENIKLFSLVSKDLTDLQDSIIDGIYNRNNEVFIVNDIYLFKNKTMERMKITERMEIFNKKVNKNIIENLTIKCNEYNIISKTPDIIYNVIPRIKNTEVKGLSFYPVYSGTKLLFLFNKNKTEQNQILTFEMKKTDTPDIYKLYLYENSAKNGKLVLIGKKIGEAYIPSIECSKMCNKFFEKEGKVLVKCSYDNKSKKWIPIEEDTQKTTPDFIDMLKSNQREI